MLRIPFIYPPTPAPIAESLHGRKGVGVFNQHVRSSVVTSQAWEMLPEGHIAINSIFQ